ncbi:uncharacterized protein LOC102074184 isoform X2 [Zonotrichia albicollis]
MRHACLRLCSSIALHLLWLLSTQEPHWDLPTLAFLVEVLVCLDSSECGNSVVKFSSRYLQSECRERRRLALRALLELIDDPSMAERMWSLTKSLMRLLGDNDAAIAGMTLITLSFILLHKHMLMSTPIAVQLAEALLPLFDHDNSQVQLLSIKLFRDMMEYLEEREKPLESPVQQSLLPLFFHCNDENRHVAEARTCGLLLSPWQGAGLLPALRLLDRSLLQAMAGGGGSRALGCGAISASLLLSRLLGKRCFMQLSL